MLGVHGTMSVMVSAQVVTVVDDLFSISTRSRVTAERGRNRQGRAGHWTWSLVSCYIETIGNRRHECLCNF